MKILLVFIAIFVYGSGNAQNYTVDSLLNSNGDTLLTQPFQRLDSIQAEFKATTDSLKNEFQQGLSEIENQKTAIQQKIDSLSSLSLPIEKYTAQLDSLNDKTKELNGAIYSKLESLKANSIGKINGMDLPPKLKIQADKVTGLISNVDLSSVSSLNMEGLGLDKLGDLGGLENIGLKGVTDVTDNLTLPSGQLPDVGNLKEIGSDKLSNIEGLKNVGGITDQIGGYSEDIKSIANSDLGEVKQIPETIEKEVMKMEELGKLAEGTSVLEEYKGIAEGLKDEESMKEMVIEKAQEEAIDHFAGQEQVLNDAMQKIAKYKQKYSSVESLQSLAKKPHNPMKGKSLIERVVPGINFQVLKKNDLLIDFNPYAGYRFTGMLTMGGGWNYRLAYNEKLNGFNSAAKIYGPRVYGEFNITKGFIGHASIEIMNTNVPAIIGYGPTPIDPEMREWVSGAFLGLKREYKLFNGVRGTVQILYKLYDPEYKYPYADQINTRFGFEFPMKKKIKKEIS